MLYWVKKLLFITGAIILVSVCVNMFLGPHNIAAGGLTGLAIILEQWIGMSRSVVILVGNGILLVITFFFLGKEVFLNTVIGATMLPFFIGIIPQVTLVNDTMLSVLVGSALFGTAVAILYKHDASSGGTSIPPLVFKKYFNLNLSVGLFLTDGIVVVLCLLVFSLDAFFYAIISIFITSATMNYIENGMNKKKMIYIISDMHEIISQEIIRDVKRGVTIIPAIGAYRNDQKQMLMVTLDKKDYQPVLNIVNKHDKSAFMITDTVTDVHGEGFSYHSGSV